MGQLAASARSHTTDLILFEKTILTNNRNNAPSPKTITTAALLQQNRIRVTNL